ncbi:endo-1,4-beta-xylanase [Paenibacillus harenae]|uniref:endo-1,4-beta-xylanase n=1 Tax=Paenibacillus harenae TaxID=306543 RepID=UPI00278E8F59|nr:endo-1,4-beta-xylanase [Paenibacillus harenae]MDQ0059110.1 endo-1,4-beta-xylanase [Paenibacillus harenae]
MNRVNNKFVYIAISAIALIAVVAVLLLNRYQPETEGALNEAAALQTEVPNSVNAEDELHTTTVVESGTPQPTSEPTPKPTPTPEPSVEQEIPSLAETFAGYFPIGAAIEPSQTEGLKAELLKKHVNWLVAENVMKPDAIQPTEGSFNWTNADRLVAFAKENGMEVRFHTLVWHSQVGAWFFKDAEGKPMVDETDEAKREANKKLLLKRLDTHVRTIVERYKNDIHSWDVVNEVIEPADPDGMRASEWYKITGTDFIETAFRAAREAGGPEVKLYINDYGTDNPAKRDRLYELVKEMLDKGVPIDGVGHQTHIDVYGPTVDSIVGSMEKFAELGLDNLVTELDMSLYAWNDRRDLGNDIPDDLLQKQADRYRELFEAFRANKDMIGGVVFWGIADDHTWLNSFPVTRTNAPFLFDKQLHAKPAFWAVVDPAGQAQP